MVEISKFTVLIHSYEANQKKKNWYLQFLFFFPSCVHCINLPFISRNTHKQKRVFFSFVWFSWAENNKKKFFYKNCSGFFSVASVAKKVHFEKFNLFALCSKTYHEWPHITFGNWSKLRMKKYWELRLQTYHAWWQSRWPFNRSFTAFQPQINVYYMYMFTQHRLIDTYCLTKSCTM